MENHGFCLFPFINDEEVQQLKSLYQTSVDESDIDGMYANHNRNNYEIGKNVSDEIFRILNDKINNSFDNAEHYIAHFVVKEAGNQNEFPLHQDWNVVDEQDYETFHIWIPLEFSHHKNGGMFVVPGSHKFFNNYRSGVLGIPMVSSDQITKKISIDLNIPRGNALVWNSATFHGSHPNESNENRISVLAVIKNKKAKTYYFHLNENKIERYPLTSDLLLQNLHDLEKGIFPNDWVPESSIPFNQKNNKEINSVDLLNKYTVKPIVGNNIYPVNKLPEVEKCLYINGFTTIDCIDRNTIDTLRNLLEEKSNYSDKLEKAAYLSLINEDFETKNALHNQITEILKPLFDKLFKDYKTPIFQFFVKAPDSDGNIGFHTDDTLILNPQIEPHYAIWIPLIDVDENNGAIQLIPGSHHWYSGVATSSIEWPYLKYQDQINEKSVTIKMNAGEILIFDNRMVHGSTYNKTNKIRPCVAGRIVNKKSEYYSFYKENNTENFIQVYSESNDYYLNEKFNGESEISETGIYKGKMKQEPFNSKLTFNE